MLPVLCACGYRFTGSGEFPYGIRRLAVENFENRTAQTGLGATITSDLITELTRRGKVDIVAADEADAVLTGIIQSLTLQTVSRSGTLTANARRVEIQVALELTESDGQVLWSAADVRENEAFDVAENRLATETRQLEAISVLSRRLAEKISNRLTEDF